VHRKTAVDMIARGGLLTEFMSGTTPDRYNFVSRNRIVAGICDATIVVESAAKGGSLITADIAESYHRDCFAFPGRSEDEYSKGCNQLIRDNKATLIQSAEDFVRAMCWDVKATPSPEAIQRALFPDLSADECAIVSKLEEGSQQINSLVVATDIPVNRMNSLLFEMEMKGIISLQAGGIYKLLT
jgi:DNA processing protein